MSGANRGIIRGESVLVYLEAEAILARIGPDPDGPAHMRTLAEALGRVCKHKGCTKATRVRGLCDSHYRRAKRIPRAVVVEEVTHLSEGGTGAEAIATALHVKLASAARSLHRAGRHDLASRFEFARVGTCAECGAPITSKATRCTPCESPRRDRDESGRWIPTDRRRAS